MAEVGTVTVKVVLDTTDAKAEIADALRRASVGLLAAWGINGEPKKNPLADAFDAGFTACAAEHSKQKKDPTHPITRVNPYS